MAHGEGPSARHVFLLAAAQTITWGALYHSFGVLLPAMERAGIASGTALGAGFSIALASAGLLAIPVGKCVDRYGARAVLCAGACAGAVTMLLMARASSLPLAIVAFLLLGAAQAGALYEPALAAIVSWFDSGTRRDRAIVVITAVAGAASTIFVPLTAMLSERLGWRAAAAILALGVGGAAVPLFAALPRHRVPTVVRRPAGARAPAPWLLASSLGLNAAATIPMTIYLFPLLVVRGHAAAFAAATVGVFGVAQVAARLLFLLPFSLSRRQLAPAILIAQAVAVAAVARTSHAAAVVACVALFGTAAGLMTLVRSAAAADWYGGRTFGARSGVLATGSVAGRAIAPLLIGSAMDAGWSPAAIFSAAGVALLIAAAVWVLGAHERANSASASPNG